MGEGGGGGEGKLFVSVTRLSNSHVEGVRFREKKNCHWIPIQTLKFLTMLQNCLPFKMASKNCDWGSNYTYTFFT